MDPRPSPSWLAQCPLFGGLPAHARECFSLQMTQIQLQAGELVYVEGDPAQELFVVGDGKLEVVQGEPGDEYVLATLGSGDFFGDLSFLDMQARSATVRALRPTLLWEISYCALREVYERDIKTYTLLVMNMARETSRRLRRADRRVAHGAALRAASRGGSGRRSTLQVITELGLRRGGEHEPAQEPALAVAAGGYPLADD